MSLTLDFASDAATLDIGGNKCFAALNNVHKTPYSLRACLTFVTADKKVFLVTWTYWNNLEQQVLMEEASGGYFTDVLRCSYIRHPQPGTTQRRGVQSLCNRGFNVCVKNCAYGNWEASKDDTSI